MSSGAVARPRPAAAEGAGVVWGVSDERCASFEVFLRGHLQRTRARRVCDVGGGANPLLPEAYLRAHAVECTVVDLSAEEMRKAPPGYRTLVADIASPAFEPPPEPFDLVFSRMLAEHVRDARQFHRNVRRLLRPGGVALHCFPTLYSVPFLVNRLLPVRAADRLLDWVQPRDRYRHAKFPAFYDWCRGPSPRQLARLEALGYQIVEYRGLFGHPYYGDRGPLARANRALAHFLARHPVPALTSYAYLALRRAELDAEPVPFAEPELAAQSL